MSVHINSEDAFKQPPLAVIFDTDNTLYDYIPAHEKALDAACSKARKLLGIDHKMFHEYYQLARMEVKNRLKGTASSHSRQLYFQRLIEIAGFKTQIIQTLDLTQTYWRTFLSNSHLFPGAKEFLVELHRVGISTAIITDLTVQIQFRKIVYFGLDSYFDYVVTSEEAGRDKPDGEPFKIALDKLKVDPERVWMIGDNPINDIQGARNFKMKTLQKVHRGVELGVGNCMPDLFFHSFEELYRVFIDREGIISKTFRTTTP